MEMIKKRYNSLLQALSTLEKGIELKNRKSLQHDPEMTTALRDTCIQRFEYTIDSFWKFIKLDLETYEQISFETINPRTILLKALQNRLLDTKEFEILIDAIADRNLTSHSYNERLAEKIIKHIPLYYQTMHAIAMKLRSKYA